MSGLGKPAVTFPWPQDCSEMSLRASVSQWDSSCLKRKVLSVRRKPLWQMLFLWKSFWVITVSSHWVILTENEITQNRRHKWQTRRDCMNPEALPTSKVPGTNIILCCKPVGVKFSTSWSWKHTDTIHVILKNSSKYSFIILVWSEFHFPGWNIREREAAWLSIIIDLS